MSWMEKEEQEHFTNLTDTFLKAHNDYEAVRRARYGAEQELIQAMIDSEFDEVNRGPYRVVMEVPDGGDVYLEVGFRSVLDLDS